MPESPVLVVVDDEAIGADVVRRAAARHGLRLVTCGAGADVSRCAADEQALAVLVKAEVAGRADALRLRRQLPAACGLLVATGDPAHDAWQPVVGVDLCAVLALPLEAGDLVCALEAVMAYLARRRSLFAAELAASGHFACAGMVGRGPAMQALFERARRVAATLRAGLVVGEPGTGKRRFAALLHSLGPHCAHPFVVVTPGEEAAAAAGLPDIARGVVYVAEPGRLPSDAQRRLLDLVRRPPGAAGTPDVVVLAGAVPPPRADAGPWRMDPALLAALSRVEFCLPPLRQRREDITGLSAVFVRDASAQARRPVRGFTPAAELLLLEAPWRGNLPELRSTLERAVHLADGELLGPDEVAAAMPAVRVRDAEGDGDGNLPLSRVEREHILRALQRLGGNKKAAARVLGLSRRALYRKLERLDLGATIARRPRHRSVDDPHEIAAAAPPARG